MNVLKRIFILFLIFNLTFVSKVQAEATFNDINGDGTGFDVSAQDDKTRGIAFNNDGTIMYYIGFLVLFIKLNLIFFCYDLA